MTSMPVSAERRREKNDFPAPLEPITRMRFKAIQLSVSYLVKGISARIARRIAKVFLDPQELIIFRDAIGATKTSRLYLTRVCGHGEIGDERILGLARS